MIDGIVVVQWQPARADNAFKTFKPQSIWCWTKNLLGLEREASLDKRLPHHRHQQGDQLFHKLGTRSTFQEVEVKDTWTQPSWSNAWPPRRGSQLHVRTWIICALPAIPYIGCWKLYESRLDLIKTCRTVAAPERGPLLANRPLPLFENQAKTFCYVNQVTELGSFN